MEEPLDFLAAELKMYKITANATRERLPTTLAVTISLVVVRKLDRGRAG
jgi:hypothetical protein